MDKKELDRQEGLEELSNELKKKKAKLQDKVREIRSEIAKLDSYIREADSRRKLWFRRIENTDRDLEIVLKFGLGETMSSIGRDLGISGHNVNMAICTFVRRHTGLYASEYPLDERRSLCRSLAGLINRKEIDLQTHSWSGIHLNQQHRSEVERNREIVMAHKV